MNDEENPILGNLVDCVDDKYKYPQLDQLLAVNSDKELKYKCADCGCELPEEKQVCGKYYCVNAFGLLANP